MGNQGTTKTKTDNDTAANNNKTEEEIRRQLVLRRLYIASALCSCFIVVEVIGGVIANSLAIMSDAAHLFSDLASFAVASKFLFLTYIWVCRNSCFCCLLLLPSVVVGCVAFL